MLALMAKLEGSGEQRTVGDDGVVFAVLAAQIDAARLELLEQAGIEPAPSQTYPLFRSGSVRNLSDDELT
jgi:hypothetical protein